MRDPETMVSRVIQATAALMRATPGETMFKANDEMAKAKAALLRAIRKNNQTIEELERDVSMGKAGFGPKSSPPIVAGEACGLHPSFPSEDHTEIPNGAEMIFAERERQLDQEGYDSEHDDEINDENELALAAMAYILGCLPVSRERLSWSEIEYLSGTIPACWPWRATAWRPATPVRMLAKAGALIAAEIDRLNRQAPDA